MILISFGFIATDVVQCVCALAHHFNTHPSSSAVYFRLNNNNIFNRVIKKKGSSVSCSSLYSTIERRACDDLSHFAIVFVDLRICAIGGVDDVYML